MRRLPVVLPFAIASLLLTAPAALADNLEVVSGEGTYGLADDKVVTNAGFIIIFALPLFLLAMTILQSSLERRKERRKAAAKKLRAGAATDWQSGW